SLVGSPDKENKGFYAQPECKEYNRCPTHYFSAHQRTDRNGLWLVNVAVSINLVIRSTQFQHKFQFNT
uniref:Uncharacterized protein n=1 Tax=Anopheles minimus TaxID=112268 RepID=A0A182W212_9DIPT